MAKLNGYQHFIGRHWETGSVCNYYAYRGVKAPHTGQPYSEALLLGVSGGIVMGYFSFAYKGYDPHVAILTRNTFDPLDTLLERLGVAQNILQTGQPEKGLANLVDMLESGLPALVWADMYSLPYNAPHKALPFGDDMWQMYPVLVYGYDEAEDTAWIADRASVPLTVTPGQLAAARGRVKKDKYRLVTLGDPNPLKLASAVSKGIWDTIQLFTDKPPKGSRENFGFAAYRRWGDLLINPKSKSSLEKVFPVGRPMIAGLTSAYWSITLNDPSEAAERDTYADFLEEASLILKNPGLKQVAGCFRQCAPAWQALAHALLPDDPPAFQQMRALMSSVQKLFIERGGEALPEITQANRQLERLKAEVGSDFPLDGGGVRRLFEDLRDRIMGVHDVEMEAVRALQEAMEVR